MAWRREALPNRRLHTSPSAFLVSFWASKKKLAAGAAKYPCEKENNGAPGRRALQKYKQRKQRKTEGGGRPQAAPTQREEGEPRPRAARPP